MIREIGEVTVAGLCVTTALLAVMVALQWSGIWPAFAAIGGFLVWFDEQGVAGDILFVGCSWGAAAVMLVLVQVTQRVLFRRQESN